MKSLPVIIASLKICQMIRSSRLEVFFKKGVPTNFAKLTGKHMCQSLFFNDVAGFRPTTLLKKRLWQRYFPVSFAKFVRTHYRTSPVATSRWFRGVFKTKSNIYDGNFCKKVDGKRFHQKCFLHRVLNTYLCKFIKKLFSFHYH